jgi:hypothetical protein
MHADFQLMKTTIFIIAAISAFISCSSRQKESKADLDSSLFSYPPLKTTTEVPNNIGSLKPLDSIQKRAFIPDITKGLQMDKEFPYSSLFTASFVSMQDKIGTIQPIILKTVADDFSALVLINLNENNSPVDYLIVDRQEFCGNDDSIACEKYRHSIFKGNEITTYELFEITSNVDDRLFYVDSIVHKSIIDSKGHFKTKKTDSIRVTK